MTSALAGLAAAAARFAADVLDRALARRRAAAAARAAADAPNPPPVGCWRCGELLYGPADAVARRFCLRCGSDQRALGGRRS